MKYLSACFAALVLALCFSGVGSAHKVNVFAYADGDAVQVEGYFTRSQKVRYGKLTVTDLVTGEELIEGITDEQGLFRFRPAASFLETGHGINVLLDAGEGHQSSWQLSPEELKTLAPSGQTEKTAGSGQASTVSANQAATAPAMETAELEALIGRVLDAKLAPIKQTLARQEATGPSLRDIVGGIGWIFGLLGVAIYMKYRR